MNIKIVFRGYPQQIEIHKENGEFFVDPIGLVLKATSPTNIEAGIIVDQPVLEGNFGIDAVEGECVATVTEQLVMTDEMQKTFAKLIGSHLLRELTDAQKQHEELERQLFQWFNELDRKEEAFINRTVDEIEKRLTGRAHMQTGAGI